MCNLVLGKNGRKAGKIRSVNFRWMSLLVHSVGTEDIENEKVEEQQCNEKIVEGMGKRDLKGL